MKLNIQTTKEYLKPSKVFIPLADIENKYYDLFVNIGDEVKLGEKIAENFGEGHKNIYSSVSGVVEGIKELEVHSGVVFDHLVIKNDKSDTLSDELKPIEGLLTTSNIPRKLTELGLTGLDEGLYTPLDFNHKFDYLVVNALEDNESFITPNREFAHRNFQDIVEGIRCLEIATNTKAIVLVCKHADRQLFSEAGLNIMVVNPNKLSWQYLAMKKIAGRNLLMNLLDEGIMYVSFATARAVNDAIHKGLPLTTRDVSVAGNNLEVNAVYTTKIGALAKELINEAKPVEEDVSVYIGSILSGKTLKSFDFAIGEKTGYIGVDTLKNDDPYICTKCGICNDVCPVGILPQNIMDAELRMLDARIFELDVDKCVECAVCSYACPSEINVLEWVRRAKRRIK